VDGLPQEVEILQGLPGVRGLELAGVEHEQADEVEPPHHGGVPWLLAHCSGHHRRRMSQSVTVGYESSH